MEKLQNKLIGNFEDLNTHIYRQVKQMIWNKTLAPGSKILQEHLAQQLGVSRTPLIKALQRLTSENLVEYIPRHGFYVKKLTLAEMMEIFAVREVVEGVAARAVAEHATDAEIAELKAYFTPFRFNGEWSSEEKKSYLVNDQTFHTRMVEIAGNRLLFQINEMFNIYRFSYQKGLVRPPDETLQEHLDIIAALEKRDPGSAQLLAMRHIQNSRENIARVIKENGSLWGELEV
ncbi:MAG TPA: GntR family transcriptional regulator [Firmicutes bacterium]|uniref:GntR family transcriptional regulator n=1 Tax=Capillibacterium thermochitinicola TaxID=2699427 RepID=A0A8J6I0Y3_9FIRM|nr:GntR family transcriptional regulator [Capillibacterium thermochitinicola]MBA2132968.1 GntR family transcriptional regulator [Capillibacterium thermochitinicola]HHW12741.1 GntR family transcriptional regulator [Bacillota bacterium]